MYLIQPDMFKIPADVINDFIFYKTNSLFKCQVCKQFKANFINLSFGKKKVFFWINCTMCGENSYWFVSKATLKQIFLKYYFDQNIDPESQEFSFWRMFQLGYYYPSCFNTKNDKEDFQALWYELENALNKFKNRMTKK